MAIQNRRGDYANFDPQKMKPGEFAIVQSNDPNASDGKAVYICTQAGTVKRLVSSLELYDEVQNAATEIGQIIHDAVDEDVQRAEDAADYISTNVEQIINNTNEINVIKLSLAELIFTEDFKAALLACFEKVAWIDGSGLDLYTALENALNAKSLLSIAASFNQGSHTILTTDSLDSLKPYLTVTAIYSDGTSETVSTYSLSGTLTVGTSSILVSYLERTALFTCTVTEPILSSISCAYTQSGAVYTTDSLDSLKANLVVTATYTDSSTATIPSTDYTLSGTLVEGTSTITASYGGKTATFTVTVSSPATLSSITATFTQGSAVIYDDASLDDLKQYLVVTANYSDSTSRTVTDYTLSGTLAVGTSTITVSYGGKTATFNVVVTASSGTLLYSWDFTQSLVDSVSGATATTTATRDSNGLTFSSANKYLDLGTVYSRDRTYEIDIDYIGTPDPASAAYRRIFAFGENGTMTSANTTALVVAMSDYRPGWYWYLGTSWDSGAIGSAVSTVDSYNYFDGKTMKIYLDSSGYGHVYAKTIGADDSTYIKIGVSHAPLNDYTSVAHVYMGGDSDRLASARIKAYRIYEGEK